MRLFLAALLGLAPAFAGNSPVAAGPAPDAAPIEVASCSVTGQAPLENPKIGFRPSQIASVTIVSTNERATAATEVHFRIRYQGTTSSVVDRGSFAPGAKMTREFHSINGIFSGPTADCSATAVTFADGTHWTAPAPTESSAPKP